MSRHRRDPSTAQIALGLAGVALVCTVLGWAVFAVAGRLGETPPPSQPKPNPEAAAVRTAAPAVEATSASSAATSSPAAEPTAPPPPALQARRVMKHIEVLADTIGVRREGTDGERRAGAYIARQLATFGYRVRYQTVALPNGTETRNVYAVKTGTSPLRIVLGAHYDSKRPSPGANDNASGVGIVLELARVLKSRRLAPTLVFAFFGAEEMIGSDGDEHHFGSRAFVERMNRQQRAQVAAMISVDMVGAGDEFLLRTMGRGPARLSDVLLAFARQVGTGVIYRKDPGESGWSDHEPFEMAGIPAAWLEWVSDPVYHTSEDTPGHIRIGRIRTTGRLLQRFITTTKIGRLRRLAAANTN